ncbi:hypothetical protein [Arcobacter vandammei]|uniref:hypothetical protein n=1 Tax=Arcobacter vandammei TaxID=2782243 RepID=UPI0018DFF3D1|nr:hypothetical protein [Arcobacter vandammei]
MDKDFKLLRQEILENFTYNPALRPWYKLAINNSQIVKTVPYLFDNIKSLGITYFLTPKSESFKEFEEKIIFGLVATVVFFILMLPFVVYLINLLIEPIKELIDENQKIIDKEYETYR